MARYTITEDVSYQEATPRGILEGSFKAGTVDAEPGTDEHFIIEYVLIPDGLAAVSAAPKTKAPEPDPEPAQNVEPAEAQPTQNAAPDAAKE